MPIVYSEYAKKKSSESARQTIAKACRGWLHVVFAVASISKQLCNVIVTRHLLWIWPAEVGGKSYSQMLRHLSPNKN